MIRFRGRGPFWPSSRQGGALETNDQHGSVAAVFDCVRAIASDGDVSAVVRTVIRCVLEIGPGDRAVLLVPDASRLSVACAGQSTASGLVVRELPEAEELPWSVVSFVRRSGQTLLLGRAAEPHSFSSDDYFAAHHPASIACIPLASRSEIIGALYVESQLQRDAFAGERLALLEILVAHAAIALAHAKLLDARRSDAAALAQQESRFANAFHASPTAMVISRKGVFVDVNEGFAALVRCPRDEIIGQTAVELGLISEEDGVRIAADLDEHRRIHNREQQVTTRSGDRRVLLFSMATIEETGAPWALSIYTDITDRRLAEEQLRQSQKMEAIGRMAGGIAHDFNNLLTVIIGFGSLGLREIDASNPLSSVLREIINAGERAAQLTRQLLAYSRRQVFEAKPSSLNAIVLDVQRLLRRLIGEDIALHTDLAPDAGTVTVDRGQVTQILLNLAVNARDAMPIGGTIAITTANVDLDRAYVDAHPDATVGSNVMLSISDSGMGMTPEVLARLFEPFFTTKEPGKGTGLGLSVVYGIVKQSAASITVSSAPDQGTNFKIFFPRSSQAIAAEEPKAPAVASASTAGEAILLVEDEDAVRGFVASTLESHGFVVTRARHGAEALQILASAREKFQLIITDVIMPSMGGLELATRVEAIRPAPPILFISGYVEHPVMDGRALDPARLLYKPFAPAQLVSKVKTLLAEGPR